MWNQCVLDASLSDDDSLCFCPIEGNIDGDFEVVTGMNFVSDTTPPRWELVAVIHPDGQEVADKWCQDHSEILERLRNRSGKR